MIPQEKLAAVTHALREAFGVTEFDDIRRITKGQSSAHVFRILVRGTPYLLRIITNINSLLGPERQFACMRAAADAGLAPRIWYISEEDHISITDFIEEVPFPRAEALVRIPAVLRALHALPPFPRAEDHINNSFLFLINPAPALDGFLQQFRSSNILSSDETGELFAWHAQLTAACPRHKREVASSHNDLFKPDNILFDGHRVWLVDWEAAFLNDRYADLAGVANLIVATEAEERAYLAEYLGEPPTEYQLARFFLMRQVAHMFYALVFLFLGTSGQPFDRSQASPEFQAFQPRMWAGEINLADKDTMTLYGRVQWEQLIRNARSPRYTEALRIVLDS